MRKITCFFLFLPSFLFAQTKNDKKFGITLNVNTVGEIASNGLGNIRFYNDVLLDGGAAKDRSYSLGINASYLLSKELGVRFKVTTTRWKFTDYRNLLDQNPNNPPYARIDNINVKSSDLSFAPAIFYHYEIEKITLTGGVDLDYIIHNKEIYTDVVSQADPNPSQAYVIRNTITVPGGNSYGIGEFIGFHFFPVDYLSVAFELSSTFLKTSIGNTVYQNTSVISGSASAFEDSYNESINSFQFGQIKGSLNISFWF